jgi:hypothetical protein
MEKLGLAEGVQPLTVTPVVRPEPVALPPNAAPPSIAIRVDPPDRESSNLTPPDVKVRPIPYSFATDASPPVRSPSAVGTAPASTPQQRPNPLTVAAAVIPSPVSLSASPVARPEPPSALQSGPPSPPSKPEPLAVAERPSKPPPASPVGTPSPPPAVESQSALRYASPSPPTKGESPALPDQVPEPPRQPMVLSQSDRDRRDDDTFRPESPKGRAASAVVRPKGLLTIDQL